MGAYTAAKKLRARQRAARQLMAFGGRFVGEEEPLSEEEITAFTDMAPFGHPDHGGGAMFGADDRVIDAAACFRWGLAGAPEHEQMVLPDDLFGMLAPYTAEMSVAEYMAMLGNQDDLTQRWVADNTAEIQRVRAMPDGTHDEVHAKVRAAAVLLIRAHGMQPDPGGDTPYAICLYYEPQDPPVANWTHWAVEIRGQALETNPGVGIWKNNGGFAAYWENWVVPLDAHPCRCHTIPVDCLTDGHIQRIRQMVR